VRPRSGPGLTWLRQVHGLGVLSIPGGPHGDVRPGGFEQVLSLPGRYINDHCLVRADDAWYFFGTVGRVLTQDHGDDACRHRSTAIQTARSVSDPKTSLAALRPQSVPAQRPGLHRSALPHSPPCSDNNAASDSCSKRIAQSSGWDPFFAWALMLAPWSISILTIF